MLSRVHALDLRIDAWVERIRGPQLDPVFYGLSSAADHGLLWLLVGSNRAARRGDPAVALRMGAALGVESLLTNGPIKAMFRRVRPEDDHPPEGPLPYGMHRPDHQFVPVGPRGVGLHRGHAPRRRTRHPGVVRARRRGRVEPGVHAHAPHLGHRRRRRARHRARAPSPGESSRSTDPHPRSLRPPPPSLAPLAPSSCTLAPSA